MIFIIIRKKGWYFLGDSPYIYKLAYREKMGIFVMLTSYPRKWFFCSFLEVCLYIFQEHFSCIWLCFWLCLFLGKPVWLSSFLVKLIPRNLTYIFSASIVPSNLLLLIYKNAIDFYYFNFISFDCIRLSNCFCLLLVIEVQIPCPLPIEIVYLCFSK